VIKKYLAGLQSEVFEAKYLKFQLLFIDESFSFKYDIINITLATKIIKIKKIKKANKRISQLKLKLFHQEVFKTFLNYF